MKVYVAQVNPTIGDLNGNLAIMKSSISAAIQDGCDVVVFPELMTTGYPPRDLLYSSEFWHEESRMRECLFNFINGLDKQITVIFGGLHSVMLPGGRYAKYNAAWIYDKHFGSRVVHKRLLPRYDVFDETRYFSSAADEPYMPIHIYIDRKGGYTVACDVLICEDIWNHGFCGDEILNPATYAIDPVTCLKQRGCRGPLFVLNGSPWWEGKIQITQALVEAICDDLQQPVVWCNQIGAHDDIITGGYSMVSIPVNTGARAPERTRRAREFQEDSITVRLSDSRTNHSNLNEGRNLDAPLIEDPTMPLMRVSVEPQDRGMLRICRAIMLHMTDYKRRCGFERSVLGLSGGIDSAVVAFFAANVFGSENVTGIGMPSPYSSDGSIDDAKRLAENLHIRFQLKPIADIYEAVKDEFLSGGKQKFDNPLTDENIQPRVRGMILMAHSNEYDPCLLLTTGNKSEITVGYCTLYGDMCGGLAVLSDLWKTQVYELARFINKYFGAPIPESTITKPASAELKPDQQDTDSLPPYELLDPLLKMFVEQEMEPLQVFASKWFSATVNEETMTVSIVKDMYRKYRQSEYKRMQMPPGPKTHRRSFGSGRRMPIAMKMTRLI